MNSIGRLWAGQIFGTNTGNLAAEIDSSEAGLSGLIRVMDNQFGLVLFEVKGSFDGSAIELTGVPTKAQEGVETGTVTVKGMLTSEGSIRGQWSSTLGTGGTFVLFPHDMPGQNLASIGLPPERFHTAVRAIGAVRLFAEDVRELIGFLSRDFSQGRVVVTYHEGGNEITRYATDFENDLAKLGELRYLKLVIQEPEAYGINKLALIELNAMGANEVRTQGVQESWVIGKAEALASKVRLSQKSLSTTFRKFGLNLNGILALFALAAVPELSFWRRMIFLLFVALVAWAVTQLHARFIPNCLISLSARRPSWIDRVWPQIISWFLAASSGLVALIAYGLLKGELSDSARWISSLFH
jgi:hypothetical protein